MEVGPADKSVDADVYMYLITPSDGFSEINFDTTVIMKVNSENEERLSFANTKGYCFQAEVTTWLRRTLKQEVLEYLEVLERHWSREATVIDGRYTIKVKKRRHQGFMAISFITIC